MADLFFLIIGVFLIATAASGLIAYGIVSAVGLGRAWRIVLSAIAAMLPVICVYSTSRGRLDVSSTLQWILVLLVFWTIVVLLLERRRDRKAKRQTVLTSLAPNPAGKGAERL